MPIPTYRILAIDEDPLMGALIAAAVDHDALFSLDCRESGESGLAQATTRFPHLILCDVSMPGLDGYAVLRALRANDVTTSIPVIFTTARADPDAVADMLAMGATAVVTKPFKLAEVVATMRRELGVPPISLSEVSPPAYDFAGRLRADAASLRQFRQQMPDAARTPALKDCVHRLAGAAGLYGFAAVSAAASDVERNIGDYTAGTTSLTDLGSNLDQLIKYVERHAD